MGHQVWQMVMRAAAMWAIGATTSAFGVSLPFAPITLDARLELTPETPRTSSLGDDWSKACDVLGKSLTSGSGPWGLGPFHNVRCEGVGPRAKPKPAAWTLLVKLASDEVRLVIEHQGSARPLATASFPAKPGVLKMLSDRSFVALLASKLIEQLPMAVQLNAPVYDGSHHTIVGGPTETSKGLPSPPPTLVVYRLSFDEKAHLFRPRFVTTAKLVASGGQGRHLWRLQNAPPPDATLWAVDGRGRRVDDSWLDERIAAFAQSFSGPVEANSARQISSSRRAVISPRLPSGILGVTYGQSIFRASGAAGLSLVSILAEFRAAPVKGLRLGYDTWPAAEQDLDQGATSFSARRATLGWSIGFAPGIMVDLIDIVPKVSLWSIDAEFSERDQSGSAVQAKFAAANALSLGLEAGLEKAFAWAHVRIWIGRDLALPQSGSGTTTVDTTRAGLTSLFNGFGSVSLSKNLKIALLAFATYENATLTKKGALASSDLAIDRVGIESAYLGGGIALSW